MKNQIVAHWIDAWTIQNIALKHEVSIQYVVQVIREGWL